MLRGKILGSGQSESDCGYQLVHWLQQQNYDFDMAFKVSSEGKITRIVYTPNQRVAACAAAKLKGASGPRPLHGPCTIFGHYSSKPK